MSNTHRQPSQLCLEQVSLITPRRGPVEGIPVLTDIYFQIFPGEFVCLSGPTGAGKSSLLRLLNRLNEPTQGKIYWQNQDIQNISVFQLRREVMLVPQEAKLLGMNVREAIAYPLILQRLPKQVITERSETYRELLNIPDDWLERSELQLSLGQRQLVAMARALVSKPKMLLLDEPTSALDIGSASRVLEVLTDLAAKEQMTVLMVNHQLELVEKFCTRLLYLQETRLIQDGIAAQIDWVQVQKNLLQAQEKATQDWF
ncbi:MAG: ATP-binding cassette domain-containing protein [Coleofasciculaceae cyanobacterium]